jgi:hypothetical protein
LAEGNEELEGETHFSTKKKYFSSVSVSPLQKNKKRWEARMNAGADWYLLLRPGREVRL